MTIPSITGNLDVHSVVDYYLTIIPSRPYWAFVLSGKSQLTETEYQEWDTVARVMFGSMYSIQQLGCCLGWWVPATGMMFDPEDVPYSLYGKQTANKFTSIDFYSTKGYDRSLPPSRWDLEGLSEFYEYIRFNRNTNNFYFIKLKTVPVYERYPFTDTFFFGMGRRVSERGEKIGNYIDIYNTFYAEQQCGYVITPASKRNFMRLSDFLTMSMSRKYDVDNIGQHNLLSELHSDVVPGSPCSSHNCVSLIVGNADNKWEALTTAFPSDNASRFLLFTYGRTPSWQVLPTNHSVFYDVDRGMPNLQSTNGYPLLQPQNFPPPDFYYYGTNESGNKGFWPISKFDCNKSSGVDTLTNIRSRHARCHDCRIDPNGSFLGLYGTTQTVYRIFSGTKEVILKHTAYIKFKVVCKLLYPANYWIDEGGFFKSDAYVGEEVWDSYQLVSNIMSSKALFIRHDLSLVIRFCKDQNCGDCLPPLQVSNDDNNLNLTYTSYSLVTSSSEDLFDTGVTVEIYLVMGINVDTRMVDYLRDNDYKYVCFSGGLDVAC